MNNLLAQQIPGGVATPLYAGAGIGGVPASNPMASQMNALLAQQVQPSGISGLPATNPLSNQMNSLLAQQMVPSGISGLAASNPLANPMNAALAAFYPQNTLGNPR
jgi:hypothetical protein